MNDLGHILSVAPMTELSSERAQVAIMIDSIVLMQGAGNKLSSDMIGAGRRASPSGASTSMWRVVEKEHVMTGQVKTKIARGVMALTLSRRQRGDQ